MSGRLQDKVAVVVGAGQTPGSGMGNGRATAIRFAEEGARLLLVDRRLASAEDTAEQIIARVPDAAVAVFEADVTSEEQCEAFVARCVEVYDRLDILHNNVGIGRGDSNPLQITEEAWDAIQNTNVKSVVFACKHALPIMRRQGSGCITNISSVAAVASANIVAYKASKAAVNAYTQSLAVGAARYGIRANVIMPGLMETPMAIEGYVAAGRDRDQLIASRNAMVPLGGRMGSAWDVANASVFLASEEARFITGVMLPVDGGQSARVG